MADWWIFRGEGEPHDGIENIPAPMLSRTFGGQPTVAPQLGDDRAARQHLGDLHRARTLLLSAADLDLINAAIYWRRPLLVTGKPGAGKSSVAHAIAHELKLGAVLHWPITSRSTLQQGLYSYDGMARVEDESRRQRGLGGEEAGDIGSYIRLGPLGTALLPHERPRVLLIDEIDKSDIDLPNDLLHVFENGEFTIPELLRLRDTHPAMDIGVTDGPDPVRVLDGRVVCQAFPIVVLTDNGERDFPPAFLRRCVRLRLQEPGRERLARIVEAHLGAALVESSGDMIEAFLARQREGTVATDQLLGAVYLVNAARLQGEDRESLAERILAPLEN